MEGPERKLRARLPNRLGGDHADRLAHLDHAAGGEVLAVAERAHAALGLTGEHRPDLDLLDGGLRNVVGNLVGDELVRFHDELVGVGIVHVADRHSTRDPVGERRNDLLVVLQRTDVDAAQGATVVLSHRHALRHVNEASREVTGVGGLERRVSQSLPRSVGANEVLLHRQALLEVGEDRVLEDFATPAAFADVLLRLGHQATHAAELANLLLRASSAGVGHRKDGVEALLVLLQGVEEHLGDLVVRLRPDVDDLVVALVVGDEAH